MTSDGDTEAEEMAAGYIRAERLAKYIGVNTRTIQRYRADGALVSENTQWGKRYHLQKSLRALILFLNSRIDTSDDKKRAQAADAKYKEYRAEIAKLDLQKRKGELHEARHVKTLMVRNILDTRAAIRAIPGRIANDLALCAGPNEIFSLLKKTIDSAFAARADTVYDPDAFRELIEEEGKFISDIEEGEDEGNTLSDDGTTQDIDE